MKIRVDAVAVIAFLTQLEANLDAFEESKGADESAVNAISEMTEHLHELIRGGLYGGGVKRMLPPHLTVDLSFSEVPLRKKRKVR